MPSSARCGLPCSSPGLQPCLLHIWPLYHVWTYVFDHAAHDKHFKRACTCHRGATQTYHVCKQLSMFSCGSAIWYKCLRIQWSTAQGFLRQLLHPLERGCRGRLEISDAWPPLLCTCRRTHPHAHDHVQTQHVCAHSVPHSAPACLDSFIHIENSCATAAKSNLVLKQQILFYPPWHCPA